MKLCFSTLGCTERSLDEILLLSDKFSVYGLEIRGVDGILDNSQINLFKEENINKTKSQILSKNVTPVVLGTSSSFHSVEGFDRAIGEGQRSIDIASSLDIPYIRVFGNNLTSDEVQCYERVVKGISLLADYAKNKNVSVLLEIHGDFNRIETLSPILDRLKNKENFGLIWDVCHTHRVYRFNWEEVYGLIKPYVRHVHIKDTTADGRLALPGEGEIPLLQIRDRLVRDGYNGYFSLEWEKKWHPELPDIEVALKSFVDLFE